MLSSQWLPEFKDLVVKIVSSTSISGLAKGAGHDPATVRRWMGGAAPQRDVEVASVISFALENGIDICPFQSFAPIYDFSPMLNYQQTLQLGPPDFVWLTASHSPPSDSTKLLGITLDCPLGIASSPIMGNEKWACAMLDLGYGLSTFKTRRSNFKGPWDPPLIAQVLERPSLLEYDPLNPPEALVSVKFTNLGGHIPDLVNSIGVPSEVPGEWQETYQTIQRHPRGKFVILSVMGDGDSSGSVLKDTMEAVATAMKASPPAIELNVSCPNKEKKNGDVIDDPDLVAAICQGAAEQLKGTDIRLVLKVSYQPYPKMLAILRKVGGCIDAVAFRNTAKVRPVKLNRDEQREPAFPGRRFGGLSGPCTFGLTVRGLKDLLRIKEELRASFGVIAIGGVSSAEEVAQLRSLGADLVQACTAPMFDPFLAWKTRFHLKRIEAEQSVMPAARRSDFMIHPRNEMESECFRNAEKAVKEIRLRNPGHAVTHEAFRDGWNGWMRGRSNAMLGHAQRMTGIRTVNDWIRILTS